MIYMWAALAALFSSIVGFGTGAAGLGQVTTDQTTPITTYASGACYAPQPDVNITLTWPTNFTNLTDHRVTLNPAVFSGKPATFTTDATCRDVMMKDTNNQPITSRKYILVRNNVRISSCKTDELAGPLTAQAASCPRGSVEGALANRGSCDVQKYADLRKVAEVPQGSEKLEVFWNPYSHNVACDYDPNKPNCGPKGDRFINMQAFIYVLKGRDAFDVGTPTNCPVLWDAGSSNRDACSHYFDVYMAEDVYNKAQTVVPETDPDYLTWRFIKGAVENCQEQNTFHPIVDVPGISIPPQFIQTPFNASATAKIQPTDATETAHYQYYVESGASNISSARTSLIQISNAGGTITPCSFSPYTTVATPTPNAAGPVEDTDNCHLALGEILFTKGAGGNVTFQVYTTNGAPQTFHFRDSSGADPAVYQYTITTDQVPQNTNHSPSLQLTAMQFSSGNEWTWATPVCKPALYFYPEKEMQLNVQLKLDGQLTVSDPPYDEKDGWNITAFPNSTLLQLTTHNPQPTTFPYLYYEADITGVTIPKEGWVIEKSKIKNKISNILETIGFNTKEIADFNEYWIPRLQDKPYYFVTLLPEDEINKKEELIFSQPTTHSLQPTTITPDTIIRTRVVFEGLEGPLSVDPPTIPTHARNGFTVTDWGGSLIGQSCTDITVQ